MKLNQVWNDCLPHCASTPLGMTQRAGYHPELVEGRVGKDGEDIMQVAEATLLLAQADA